MGDPSTVYINMSTVCPGTLSTILPQPIAYSIEKRNAPIVSNTARFKAALVRASIDGNRMIPLFMPAIVPNQPLLGLTPYSTTLSLTVFEGQSLQQFPGVACTYYLDVQSFDGNGNTLQTWTSLTITFAGDTQANFLIAMNTAFAASSETVIIQKITATATAGGNLIFTCSAVAGSGAFQITTGLFGQTQTPSTAPSQPQAFGLANLAAGSPPLNYIQTSDDFLTITTPNACFYQPPKLVTTQTASQSVVWVSQTGQSLPPPDPTSFFLDSPALWTYDYQWFVALYNQSVLGAFNKLVAQCAAAGFNVAFQCPLLQYSSNAFTYFADNTVVPSQQFPNGPPLNAAPFGLSFRLTISLSQMLGDLLLLPCSWSADRSTVTLNFTQSPASSSAEFTGFSALTCDCPPTENLWSPVGSIGFITAQIPTRNEITGAPVDVSQQSTTTETGCTTMLSDVIVVQSGGSTYASSATVYEPFQWRWADMTGGSLITLDMRLAWRNRYTGSYTPIPMNPGATSSLKLALSRM